MLHIIQNEARVPPGAYGSFLAEAGIPCRMIRLHQGDALPEPADIRALLVLGGTMGVHEADCYAWMRPLQQLMLDATRRGTPLLGICLGGQLLASALGGSVSADRCGERGVQEIALTPAGSGDPLLAGFPATLPVMQWHHDSFDLPPASLALASSAACPVQAFRCRNAYGLQFHPEVDAAVVADWSRGETDADALVAAFAAAHEQHGQHWRRLLVNFLRLAGLMPARN